MASPGRPKALLELTESERSELERLLRTRKSGQALALRARIVLGCASGVTNTEVSEKLGVTMTTVCKWRQRFVERRLDGLCDEPRPGTPRRIISDDQVEVVVRLTLESMFEDASHWSRRSLAKRVGMTATTVGRIWKAFRLKPHYRWHRSVEFRRFLDVIDSTVPAEIEVHLVLDNYTTHNTALIHQWLVKRPRFHLHFTPTKRFLAESRRAGLRRADHQEAPALRPHERPPAGARHLRLVRPPRPETIPVGR